MKKFSILAVLCVGFLFGAAQQADAQWNWYGYSSDYEYWYDDYCPNTYWDVVVHDNYYHWEYYIDAKPIYRVPIKQYRKPVYRTVTMDFTDCPTKVGHSKVDNWKVKCWATCRKLFTDDGGSKWTVVTGGKSDHADRYVCGYKVCVKHLDGTTETYLHEAHLKDGKWYPNGRIWEKQ